MGDKIKLGCLAVGALLAVAVDFLCLAVAYGAVVIIFRYEFGVELWRPLHWPN